ncbi:MAG: FAD-binding oxidoreductase [Actinobacteria bacterium]|nr:FAD-binding oxidoreductase [Actinomycetota bacterium]
MKAGAVVCGAGIAGVATAFQLVVEQGMRDVVLVDPLPPLTLTSDKSTECYRNWWPNAPMVGLMNRSIDLLEDYAHRSGNAFHLSRHGYLYVTADRDRLSAMEAEAGLITDLGGGPHDFYADGDRLRAHFPFLTESAVGGLHARRAGWFSAQQLGAWMLAEAKAAGLELIKGEATSIDSSGGRIRSVTVDGATIETPAVINAAGPMVKKVARLVGVDLPVYSEVHIKVAFRDHLRVIPRASPMVIWTDPQQLDWSKEERSGLEEMGRDDLLNEMPPMCHYRPEGGAGSEWIVGLWEYHRLIQEPVWPLPDDSLYPEAVMRGLTTLVPGLRPYLDHLPQPVVDGGYYTKTRENRPLVTRLGPAGSYLIGAFSGFGVMAAAAAGELLAQLVTGRELPVYARSFGLDRYQDPSYLAEIDAVSHTGQI